MQRDELCMSKRRSSASFAEAFLSGDLVVIAMLLSQNKKRIKSETHREFVEDQWQQLVLKLLLKARVPFSLRMTIMGIQLQRASVSIPRSFWSRGANQYGRWSGCNHHLVQTIHLKAWNIHGSRFGCRNRRSISCEGPFVLALQTST